MLNVSRLREELRFITINPDKHEQGLWAEATTVADVPEGRAPYSFEAPRPSACGSFGCLAGNTAIHEPGVELDWYKASYRTENGKKIQLWQADDILGETMTRIDDWDGTKYSSPKSISMKARELLGLTEHQADLLFDGDNTLDQLWELADQFSGGEITSDKSAYWSDYSVTLRERDEKLHEVKSGKAVPADQD